MLISIGNDEGATCMRGTPLPLGAHVRGAGINFAVFSRHACRVWLELFDHATDAIPARSIELDATYHRTGDIWHLWVRGLDAGQHYAYRMEGPYQPEAGHRFNVNKLLLDPYARAISPLPRWDFGPARGYDPSMPHSRSALDNAGDMPKCIVTHDRFDWQDDLPPRHPWSKTIIYELHVRGFTIHPSANVIHPGTYLGLMEKIPYLKDLGITAVELMPIHEFNEVQLPEFKAHLGTFLHIRNYWGYNSVAFFAPKASYSSGGGQGQQVDEFKEMVRAFHQAGIEVILDVVFNHTAEGDELGPTFCWRGIDNAIFYMLAADKCHYRDLAGTGNTLNANHPIVQDYIVNALRYWVVEMHVDGFRFDLASILGRDRNGKLLANAPLPTQIAEDPVLQDVKIIAEAWDIGGAYEVGSFSEQRWAEWNDRYRDDIRRFWRGDTGMLGLFASRICGSADLYMQAGKSPENSINFVTCHDGFTLNDLVSYAAKHNEANGEHNVDGTNDNYSTNFGVEGETTDTIIEALRERQIKNFLLTLLISRGVPMLLGGDEFRRTQNGNNNAYCQDNDTSWHDWQYLERHAKLFSFTRSMMAFRHAHPVLSHTQFYTDADLQWFGPQGGTPCWSDPEARQCGCLIQESADCQLFMMFNAATDPIDFRLPPLPSGAQWRLVVDTAHEALQDLFTAGKEHLLTNTYAYQLSMRSSVILIAR